RGMGSRGPRGGGIEGGSSWWRSLFFEDRPARLVYSLMVDPGGQSGQGRAATARLRDRGRIDRVAEADAVEPTGRGGPTTIPTDPGPGLPPEEVVRSVERCLGPFTLALLERAAQPFVIV